MTPAPDATHARHRNWKASAAQALAGTGVHASRPVHANLTAPALVAEALRRDEGRLSIDGALVVNTGVHTGRSAQDKFVVDEPSVTGDIWWGKVNNRLRTGEVRRAEGARAGLSAGPGTVHPGPLRRRRPGASRPGPHGHHRCLAGTVRPQHVHPPAPRSWPTSSPTTSSCTRHLFQTDPAIDGVRSGTTVALSFEQRTIVIAGTEYAGEIKKSIFTVMNWILPATRRAADALQRQHRRRGRRRAVLRPVRHRQDHAVLGPAPPADRRRRARLGRRTASSTSKAAATPR